MIRTYNADFRDMMSDILRENAERKMIVVSDPPFNVGYHYGEYIVKRISMQATALSLPFSKQSLRKCFENYHFTDTHLISIQNQIISFD